MLVVPGWPSGTPAVISTVSLLPAMPWARASSRAWLLTCSISRIGASTTEYTPQATVSLRAVAVLGVRLRIGVAGRSREARRLERPDSV